MNWSLSDVSAQAEKNFESAWMKTIGFAPSGGFTSKTHGKSHPVAELVQKIRHAFISNGYTEMFLPLFIKEVELSQQLGPEAPLALGDSFLASVYSRNPVASSVALQEIQRIAPTFNAERLEVLKSIITSYASEEFGSDELLSRVVESAGVRMDQAAEIINLFLHKEVEGTGLALRPSLTLSWFETLAATMHKEPLPLQMFSIGPSFRRAKRGMRVSYLASAAVMAGDVSVNDGETLVKSLLSPLGLSLEFLKSVATSKLFIPGTEERFYAGKVLLGKLGLLSPISLSAYGISTPVLVFEFSVDALAVAAGIAESEKAALYPQFFGEWSLTDKEIASLIRIGLSPSSWGKELASKIVKTARLYFQHPAPCEFKLLEKEIGNHRVEAWLVGRNGMLCGPDYDNELFVYDGSIIASSAMGTDGLSKAAVSKGVKTRITFLEAFAAQAGALVEENPLKPVRLDYGIVHDPMDANIVVPELVRNYIRSKKSVLAVNGNVGLSVETRVKRLWLHEQPR